MLKLNEEERRKVFTSVVTTTASKFADPKMNGIDWLTVSAAAADATTIDTTAPHDNEAEAEAAASPRMPTLSSLLPLQLEYEGMEGGEGSGGGGDEDDFEAQMRALEEGL